MVEGHDDTEHQSGSYRVEVVPLAGRLFSKRPYSQLLKIHSEVFSNVDFSDFKSIMSAIARYAQFPVPSADIDGSLQQARSVWTLLQAVNDRDERLVLENVSSWLSGQLKQSISSLCANPNTASALTPLDQTFLHLTANDIESACDSAWNEDPALALLVAQAGQHTSLSQDMRTMVDWLENRGRSSSACALEYRGPNGKKALQLYRLLAGDVDEVLDQMRCDAADPARRDWLPGLQLLDWKRCFGLYLWYTFPDSTTIAMPPEGMPDVSRRTMYQYPVADSHDGTPQRFSLRGAFLYYMHHLRRDIAVENSRVSHPFPAYLEARPAAGSAAATASSQLQAFRAVWPLQVETRQHDIPLYPPHVADAVGGYAAARRAGGSAAAEPGHGTLRPGAVGSRPGRQAFLQGGWPVDVCFQVLHLLHAGFCGQDAGLAGVLATETHSRDALDHELAWHLHEALDRLLAAAAAAGDPAAGGPSGDLGLLCRRMRAGRVAALSVGQRAALCGSLAMQLEAAGQWPLAAYVILSLPVGPWAPGGGGGDAARLRELAEAALRALIARNAAGGAASGAAGGPVVRESDGSVGLRLEGGAGAAWVLRDVDMAERLNQPIAEVCLGDWGGMGVYFGIIEQAPVNGMGVLVVEDPAWW
jgi:hypothetical protein